jgi:hypothetical protein
MALAIASGGRFLGLPNTRRCRVLLVSHGLADSKAMKERRGEMADGGGLLEITGKWQPIGLGCVRELAAYKAAHPDLRVVFLGDFESVKSPINVWFEHLKQAMNEHPGTTDPFTKQHLLMGMETDNVQRLRDFSAKSGVSVVIGQNLNTHGKLYSGQALRYRDSEIHVRTVWGQFRLEVVPPSAYIQTMSWELAYDEGRKLFRATIKAKRKEARQMGKLALTENDKRIIEAMQGKGVMSPGAIAKVTGLSRSTVYQRLEALEKQAKGCRVIGLEAPAGGKVYFADPSQPPEW